MQVAVNEQQDTYRPCLPSKEHIGKSIAKDDKQVTCLEEKGSSICTKKPQTIESLLPDEEDLFSGVIDESGCTVTADGDDEDFDLFSSNGGMEFEGNSTLYFHQRNSATAETLNSNKSSSDYLLPCEYPSRTLLVKNVDNTIEDSELRTLFEEHGDIRTFHTTCRSYGFVIITYHDIRAATLAFCTLRNRPWQNQKFHIHYSYPKDDPSGLYMDQASLEVFNSDSSISNDKLHHIFGSFGEIEKIYGTTHHRHIEYYDIRAAEAAIKGLNSSNMLQEIKLKVSYPACAKRLMQQFTHGLVQGQLLSCENPNRNSLPQDVPVQANCCSTNCFPSPVGMTSIYDQFGHVSHYSADQAKLHNQCTSLHLRSLPISREVDDNSIITYDSLNLESVGFTTETSDEHLHMLGHYVSPMEDIFRGSSGLSIHHHAWSGSNSFQTHQLNPLIWSHSPPFDDGAYAHRISNLPTLSEVLPPVLYTVSPTHKQHIIRSAPSGSLSCKDLQMSFMEESYKADLILNPVQVVGFPSAILHQSRIVSEKASPDSMMCSHTISNISPEKESGTTSPPCFSRPRGRVRRTSHGRHETVSSHTHEKKYELDIERVLRGEDSRTTLMIRNIPNKYSSAMLLTAINEHNQGTYDFIYLPLDFKNKCNMGYAFINMIDPLQIVGFHKSFNGKKWEKFHSGKVACLAYARIQGKAALIAHFQESSLMNEDKCCHPILFSTDGPNAGTQEPFPLGPSHSRRNKNRSLNQKAETTT